MVAVVERRMSTVSCSDIDMEGGNNTDTEMMQLLQKNDDKVAGPIRKTHLKITFALFATIFALMNAWWFATRYESLNPMNEKFMNLYYDHNGQYYQGYWSVGFEEKREAKNGLWYFRSEFVNYYGWSLGSSEWNQAERRFARDAIAYKKDQFTHWFGYSQGLSEWYAASKETRYYRKPYGYVYTRPTIVSRRVVYAPRPSPPPVRRVVVTRTVAPPPPPVRRTVIVTRRVAPPPPRRTVVTTVRRY